jgi:Uma2 family endonuclease
MATVSVDYPTSDGRPMAETDLHRDLMVELIQTLQAYYAADPNVYVSGNLLLYYVEGDRRRHLSPDVFVVKGVPKGPRLYYLLWEEGRGPDVVIELTSASIRDEDVEHKMGLYRDVLKVPEYFLFDPNLEYLDPALQGYRLQKGVYVPIEPVNDRLPSEALGLHLEQDDTTVRLFDPATGERLPTPAESLAAAAAAVEAEREARRRAEAELEQLRQELEQLRRPPAADNP